jgi:bifunctional ADP-heptose synthase (sugar kinase/adenylyltransferase)
LIVGHGVLDKLKHVPPRSLRKCSGTLVDSVLDTRSKIVTSEAAREKLGGRPAVWVSGCFDPLLAQHVRWLRGCAAPGQLLVVEVANPARPYLAQRARAELVAALSMVDYVVLANGDASSNSSEDPRVAADFIQHVLRRHREEAAG